MEIRITYVFKKQDGVIGYSCGIIPTDVEILEERKVLFPNDKYILERISDKEHLSCVWLKDGDTQDNYVEVQNENSNN